MTKFQFCIRISFVIALLTATACTKDTVFNEPQEQNEEQVATSFLEGKWFAPDMGWLQSADSYIVGSELLDMLYACPDTISHHRQTR